MVTIARSVNVDYTMTLSIEEATYLKALTQNYLGGDTAETVSDTTIRTGVFSGLESIMAAPLTTSS